MKIGYFTERPYQDPDLMEGRMDMIDLIETKTCFMTSQQPRQHESTKKP